MIEDAARAIKAGARADRAVENQFWGDRMGSVIDPFGHKWSLATHVEDVPPEGGNCEIGRLERRKAVSESARVDRPARLRRWRFAWQAGNREHRLQ
ncbi:MAG: hypothetical protein IPQ17_08485 [Xanthomonadales bacterium]|nr:hypothetical protein [Xanthomonadales bacterium]